MLNHLHQFQFQYLTFSASLPFADDPTNDPDIEGDPYKTLFVLDLIFHCNILEFHLLVSLMCIWLFTHFKVPLDILPDSFVSVAEL
jgi:hypothetical protein